MSDPQPFSTQPLGTSPTAVSQVAPAHQLRSLATLPGGALPAFGSVPSANSNLLGAGTNTLTPLAASQMGASQMGASQLMASQMGPSQLSVSQMAVSQVGAVPMGVVQSSISQVGLSGPPPSPAFGLPGLPVTAATMHVSQAAHGGVNETPAVLSAAHRGQWIQEFAPTAGVSQTGGVSQSAPGTQVNISQTSGTASLESVPVERPLRVIHVGECMVRAGIEQWLKGLIRFSDPQHMRMLRCIATSEYVDPQVAAEMGVPVEMGKHLSVQRAALECDVLLTSGPAELGYWLQGIRPQLCVFVAHGECEYTQRILNANAPVVDHVVAVSGRAQQVCGDVPSTVILNGVDAAHVAQSRSREEVRTEMGFTSDDYVVGFVGRFSEEKRPHAVIDAVAQLPARFKAMLVGWGPLRGPLMEYANQRIPGRYAFAEAGDHLGDYYHAMDSFCLPSATEGFGLVVLEAMLCGKPVIVTPVGCVPEVVQDRVNGVVVSGDAHSLTNAIELLEQHPVWAQSIADEGRAYAERNGHALRMARDYQHLLTQLWRQRQETGSTAV